MKGDDMNDHLIEQRERTIIDSFCRQDECEYKGMPAVQGHCFSRPDDMTEKYITNVMEKADRALAQIKEIAGDEYLKHLESYYVTAVTNWDFTLDELVRLRRENAALKSAR